jgi:DNA-binding CsgD family transcriptional regulator
METYSMIVSDTQPHVAAGMLPVYLIYKERRGGFDQTWPDVLCQELEVTWARWLNTEINVKAPELREHVIYSLTAHLMDVAVFEFGQFIGHDINKRQPAWLVELTGQDKRTEITVTLVSDDPKITRLYKGFIKALETWAQNKEIQQTDEPLTARETEIAHCLADGQSDEGIAKNLIVAEGTIKKHRQNIKRKWGAQSEDNQTLQIEARRRGYGQGR